MKNFPYRLTMSLSSYMCDYIYFKIKVNLHLNDADENFALRKKYSSSSLVYPSLYVQLLTKVGIFIKFAQCEKFACFWD